MTEEATVIVSDPILSGTTTVNNAVIRNPSLSQGARLTYTLLVMYARQKGACFPGVERLAQDLGVERHSATRYVNELLKAGVVNRTNRSRATAEKLDEGEPRTNIYELPPVPINAGQGTQKYHAREHSGSMGREHGGSIEKIRERKEIGEKKPDSLSVACEEKDEPETEDDRLADRILGLIEQPNTGLNRERLRRGMRQCPEVDHWGIAMEYWAWQLRVIKGDGKKRKPHIDRVGGLVNMWKDPDRNGTRHRRALSAAQPDSVVELPADELRPEPSGIPIWDEIRHWARHLSDRSELPQRMPKDDQFEDFKPVSFTNGVLILRAPSDFHSYDRQQWTSTIPRIAGWYMGQPITFRWAEDDAGKGAA
jgi:hypothetical protein